MKFVWLQSLLLMLLTAANAQSDTNEPTPPSLSPTNRPSKVPSGSPTAYPTITALNGDTVLSIAATVPVVRLTIAEVNDELEFFDALFADSAGLDVNAVDINVDSIVEQDDTTDFYTNCNGTGVLVNYEILSEDVTTYSSIRLNIDKGTFESIYDNILESTYSERTKVCTYTDGSVTQSISVSYTTVDYDDAYPPEKEPTFEENLWSEYLFFGFITSFLGVVWLWYLRSEVDDADIYVPDKKASTKGDAANVEMIDRGDNK